MAIVRQLLSAVERLHSLRIVHRDIKPERALRLGAVERDVGGGRRPPVAHQAVRPRPRASSARRPLSTPCGSTGYMAPEVPRGRGGDGDRLHRARRHVVGGLRLPTSCSPARRSPPPRHPGAARPQRADLGERLLRRPRLRPRPPRGRPRRGRRRPRRCSTRGFRAPSTPLQTPLAVRRAPASRGGGGAARGRRPGDVVGDATGVWPRRRRRQRRGRRRRRRPDGNRGRRRRRLRQLVDLLARAARRRRRRRRRRHRHLARLRPHPAAAFAHPPRRGRAPRGAPASRRGRARSRRRRRSRPTARRRRRAPRRADEEMRQGDPLGGFKRRKCAAWGRPPPRPRALASRRPRKPAL